MAYEKQTWQCGEAITADKLNHMEDGIANSGGGGAVYRMTVERTDVAIATLEASFNDLVASNGGVAHYSENGIELYTAVNMWGFYTDVNNAEDVVYYAMVTFVDGSTASLHADNASDYLSGVISNS